MITTDDLNEVIAALAPELRDFEVFQCEFWQIVQLCSQSMLALIQTDYLGLFSCQQGHLPVLSAAFRQIAQANSRFAHDVVVYEVLDHLPADDYNSD